MVYNIKNLPPDSTKTADTAAIGKEDGLSATIYRAEEMLFPQMRNLNPNRPLLIPPVITLEVLILLLALMAA